MSVHVTSWVLRNSGAKLGDRLVLLALADKAEADGTNARPSVPTLAEESRLSERQVQRCLRNLEAAKAIEKTGTYRYPGQRNGVNVYTVNMSPFESPKGDIHDIQTVTPTSPNPSLGTVQDQTLAAAPQNGRARNPIWDSLTELFGEATTRSSQTHRGKIVKSLTEAGATSTEIQARAARWPRMFPNAKLTEAALEKHWPLLEPPRPPPVKLRPGEREITDEERAAGVVAAKEGLRQLKGAKP